jgi:hypothetical protein
MSIRWLKAAVRFQVLFVLLAWSAAASAADANRGEVEALIKQYWSAEVGREYGKVWDILSPLQQLADPRDEYIRIRNEKGPITILAAEVKQVEVSGDLAWAHVKYDWVVANFPGYPVRPAERWQQWRHTDRWYPLAMKEMEEWPAAPPSLRPAADEAAVKARVEQMWKARVAEDMKTIYDYMSPAFKAAVPLEQFTKGKRAKFQYVSAKVDWVEAHDSQARARVTYSYKENDAAMSKMKPIESSTLEPWIKAEGSWYIDALVPDVPPPQAEPATEPPKQAASEGGKP